jgi:hypothetical protein
VRTTLAIDDVVLLAIKEIAAKRKTTVGRVLSDVARQAIADRKTEDVRISGKAVIGSARPAKAREGSRRLATAREGAQDNLSPALGAGKTDVAEFRGRGGGHHKVLGQREIL